MRVYGNTRSGTEPVPNVKIFVYSPHGSRSFEGPLQMSDDRVTSVSFRLSGGSREVVACDKTSFLPDHKTLGQATGITDIVLNKVPDQRFVRVTGILLDENKHGLKTDLYIYWQVKGYPCELQFDPVEINPDGTFDLGNVPLDQDFEFRLSKDQVAYSRAPSLSTSESRNGEPSGDFFIELLAGKGSGPVSINQKCRVDKKEKDAVTCKECTDCPVGKQCFKYLDGHECYSKDRPRK